MNKVKELIKANRGMIARVGCINAVSCTKVFKFTKVYDALLIHPTSLVNNAFNWRTKSNERHCVNSGAPYLRNCLTDQKLPKRILSTKLKCSVANFMKLLNECYFRHQFPLVPMRRVGMQSRRASVTSHSSLPSSTW